MKYHLLCVKEKSSSLITAYVRKDNSLLENKYLIERNGRIIIDDYITYDSIERYEIETEDYIRLNNAIRLLVNARSEKLALKEIPPELWL